MSLAEYIKGYFAKSKTEKQEHEKKMKSAFSLGMQIIGIGLVVGGISITSYQFGKLAERKRWCDSYPFVEKCDSIPDIIFEKKKAE